MNSDFYIAPIVLSELFTKIATAISEALPDKHISAWNFQTNCGGDSIGLNVPGANLLQNGQFDQKIHEYRDRPYIELISLSVTIQANVTLKYILEENHRGPFLRITFNESNQDRGIAMELSHALHKHVTFIPKAQLAAAALTDTQLKGFQFAQQVVASLAAETAKISSATTQSFESFIQGVKERTLELETEFQKKTTELEEKASQKRDALEKEYSAKQQDLEAQKQSHAEAVKQFELRNNTAVRRDLLREIRSKIESQKTIVISDATILKRRVIHWVCVATLILSASVAIALVSKLVFGSGEPNWRLLVPLGAWTALFVTTGVYYIRWNDQWFRDHARVEFDTRKFSADILRASWVAELFFEWAEKKNINMPPELIESFTKNLFDPSNIDSRLHPADQLSDLMKQVSSFELNKGGIKFTKKDGTSDRA